MSAASERCSTFAYNEPEEVVWISWPEEMENWPAVRCDPIIAVVEGDWRYSWKWGVVTARIQSRLGSKVAPGLETVPVAVVVVVGVVDRVVVEVVGTGVNVEVRIEVVVMRVVEEVVVEVRIVVYGVGDGALEEVVVGPAVVEGAGRHWEYPFWSVLLIILIEERKEYIGCVHVSSFVEI